MRKFAVTTFAVLYLLMAVSLSAQHSLSHHSAGRNSHHLGKAERTDSLLYEKKLLEKQLVADAPGEAAALPLKSDQYVALVAAEYQPAPSTRPSPSRAPPILL
jgi:hypothetical protein